MPKLTAVAMCLQRQARGKGRSKAAPSCRRASTLRMLQEREAGMLGGTACAMSAPQRCHLGAFVYQPAVPVHCIDTMHSRAYIGQFSGDGDVFIGVLLPLSLHLQSPCLSQNLMQCVWAQQTGGSST